MKIGPYKNLVILGGGPLLVDIYEWAVSNRIDLRVVTSPRLEMINVQSELTLKEFLLVNSIPFESVVKLDDDFIKNFLEFNVDSTMYLSMGAPWIIKENQINEIFKANIFNMHGTRLPMYRGGAAISWQILNQDRFGYCQLHHIDGGIDTGNIVAYKEFIYPATCRVPLDFRTIYINENRTFILDCLSQIFSGGFKSLNIRQANYLSSYWPRLSSDINGWVDWSLNGYEIERLICAFDEPYPGAQTYLNGKKAYLKKVSVCGGDPGAHTFQAGIIYRKGPGFICVAAKKINLLIESVVVNGVDILDQVMLGDRFFTPEEILTKSRQRVAYGPNGPLKI